MPVRCWYRAIPHPLRWAVGCAIVMAGVGVVYGVLESVRDYPPSSWFGVTLYVTLLGGFAGFVLGLVTGAVRIFARTVTRNWRTLR